jgi:DNA-binding CsgD family transcriptional regulator
MRVAIFIVAGESNVRHASAVQQLHDVASHLAAAWRTRNALSVDAACSPTAREVLRCIARHHAQAADAQRSSSDEMLWPALLDGTWSLLDTFTADHARHVVACRNPASASLRALSSQERTILELALSGRSGKWIAYELVVSESGVTRALRSALTKIGAAHMSDLLGLPTARFGLLPGMKANVTLAMARLAPARPLPATLSGAERAIVTGIADGKHVAAIARERGTSPRTVAHQLASIYRKLGASSRREVLALLAW